MVKMECLATCLETFSEMERHNVAYSGGQKNGWFVHLINVNIKWTLIASDGDGDGDGGGGDDDDDDG